MQNQDATAAMPFYDHETNAGISTLETRLALNAKTDRGVFIGRQVLPDMLRAKDGPCR